MRERIAGSTRVMAVLALFSLFPRGAVAMTDEERSAVRSAVDSGKTEDALAEAEKAVARDGADPEAAGEKAALLLLLDRREEALSTVRSFSSSHKEAERKSLDRFSAQSLDFCTRSLDEKVRLAAIESIEKTVEKTEKPRWNEALHRAMLGDPKPELRQAAAHTLRRVGGKSAARDFFRRDLGSPDESVGRMAADALVRMGDDSAADYLRKEIASPDAERRRWAAKALLKLGDDVAVPAIAKDLQSEDRALRLASVHTLTDLDSKATIPEFKKALADEDADVRRVAALALAARGDSTGLDVIRETLRAGSASDRMNAIGAVEALGAKEALPELKIALQDPDPKVQEASADLLDKFGDPEGKKWKDGQTSALKAVAGVALLPIAIASKAAAQRPPEEKIADTSRYVRSEGAREAAEVGPDQARRVFQKGLADKDPLVRASTVWSVAEARDETLLPVLVEKTGDSDPAVRLGACGAILVVLSN